MRKIFLTFSSQEVNSYNKILERIINLIDESKEFQILHRWFDDKQSKNSNIYKIYERSTKALLNADLVVAEVSTPSIGVGQQIAFAMAHKIPVVVLVKFNLKKEKSLLFLKGIKSARVIFYYYKNEGDIVNNLIQTMRSVINDNFEKLNFMATKSIKKLLSEESKKRKLSQSELLRQIIVEWKDKNNLN
jgi:hypothetical protein